VVKINFRPEMTHNQLWYTRRGKEIRGPFPKKLISRYLLIGRVLQSDEVSVDQRGWKTLSQLPELIPEEMKADLSIPENLEKLRLARLREDERKYGDRRQQGGAQTDYDARKRRSGDERRESETVETLRHRLIKTRTSQLITATKPHYRNTAIVFSLITVLVIAFALLYSPAPQVAINDCSLAPQPQVNWSNCRFEGLRLGAVDLRGASLQNTSLINAKISGANLSHAKMSYSNLLNADIRNTNLSHCTLFGSVLRNAKLHGVNLQHSDLRYAILHGADLTGDDLSNANLSQAVLSGAVLSNTTLNGAILDGAIWIDNTVCAPESIGKCIALPAKESGR
jgi:hypothetical protein